MSRRRITVPKDYRDIVAAARAQGWQLTQQGKGHPKLTDPQTGYAIPIPGTSRAVGTRKFIIVQLRKHGVTLDGINT